jgi:hypothetical protein
MNSTFASSKYANVAIALPSLRWQSLQWHTMLTTGLPRTPPHSVVGHADASGR